MQVPLKIKNMHIQKDIRIRSWQDDHGVKAMVVGNRHDDSSSNPG